MIVQELLKEADLEKQVEIVLRNQPDYEKPYDKEVVKENLSEFLEMLSTLTPRESKEDSEAPYVFVAEKYYDTDLDDNIKCYDTMELYSKKALNEFLEKIKDMKVPVLPDNLESMTSNEIKELVYDLFPDTITGYGYEFTPWEEILGVEVLYIPTEEDLKQECIASILYEMSFNGMTRDSQDERREELDASIKESEEIRKLPKEEQEKHYHSVDDLFDELGYTPPSQEEREKDLKNMWLCTLKTHLYRFQNFKNIV